MQMLDNVTQGVQKFVADNAITILTAGGVVGTVTTAILAGRAGIKAGRIFEAEEQQIIQDANDHRVLDDFTKTDKAKLVWVQFAPPVILGVVTVGSIIMSHRMSAAKAAALAAAYGLSEKQLREYKEKVQEKLTGPKAESIQDELAQDRVNNTPGGGQIIVMDGHVLCFDQPSGRYFNGSMEGLQRAVNRVNEEIIHHGNASLGFYYEELGLPPTSWSDDLGWSNDNILDVKYSMVWQKDSRGNDQKPCLAIDFVNLPKPDFIGHRYGT